MYFYLSYPYSVSNPTIELIDQANTRFEWLNGGGGLSVESSSNTGIMQRNYSTSVQNICILYVYKLKWLENICHYRIPKCYKGV